MPPSESTPRKPAEGSLSNEVQHSWDVSPREAIAIQKKLAGLVIRENRINHVTRIAGVDVGVKEGMARAAVAVLSLPALRLIEYARAELKITFPYIPGLLSFREGPVIISAFGKLKVRPDMIIFDGQGIAHPRRLGIASHIGLLLDVPAIGCAKSRLCGRHEEPGFEKGDFSLLKDNNETIGAVVRTRRNVRPVFVSTGYKVDLPTSLEFVLKSCTRFRLPETTRSAHRLAGLDNPV
ncbi:MAG: deoxyribonuclease V [Candidatus Adiutricales bacterium]